MVRVVEAIRHPLVIQAGYDLQMRLIKVVAAVVEIRNHRANSLRVASVEREQIVSSPMKQIPNRLLLEEVLVELVASGVVVLLEAQRMHLEDSVVRGDSKISLQMHSIPII